MTTLGIRCDGTELVLVHLADDGAWTATRRDAAATDAAGTPAASIRAAVAADLAVLLRVLRFPFTDARKIARVVPLSLQEQLPGDAGAYERQAQIGADDQGGFARVLLTERSHAAAALAAAAATADELRTLQPEALLAHAHSGSDEHTAYLWLTARRTTVMCGAAGAPTRLAALPIGLDQLGAPGAAANWLHRVVKALPNDASALMLDGWGRGDNRLESALAPLAMRLPCVWREPAAGEPEDPAVRIAWLAARELAARRRPGWDLAPRRPLLSRERLAHPLVRALMVPGGIAALIAIAAFAMGTRTLRAEAAAHRFEANEIMRRQFPSMRIVDPVRQLTAIVSRGGAGGGAGAPVIERLTAFHGSITATGELRLSELRTADGEWQIKGEAGDFAGVDAVKEGIESLDWPSDVEVQRAEQTVDKSAIRFQIAWRDAGSESP